MNREFFDKLIVFLMSIEAYAKNIHYNVNGDSFYGKHLFADRFIDNLNDYIDGIKETCLAGHGLKVLPGDEYLKRASELTPDGFSFELIKNLFIDCLEHIETASNVSRGDSKLLDDIGYDLQNNLGLINIMFEDLK